MENAVKSFEPSIDHFIRIIGSGIEIFGVLVIVIGIVWSTYRQLRQPISEQDAEVYKIPHRSITLARPRGARGGRYRQNDCA